MPTELTMPALSPTMEHGTLAKWLVKEGDSVEPGDLIAEIETDKATMEFEAVDPGVIAKLLVDEGAEEVAVGTPIAMLAEEGEDISDVEAPPRDGEGDRAKRGGGGARPGGTGKAEAREEDEPTPDQEKPPARKTGDAPDHADKGYGRDEGPPAGSAAGGTKKTVSGAASAESGLPPAGPAPTADGERLNVTPLARRIARAKGIDLSQVEGSGPKGRIVKDDVLAIAEGAPVEERAAARKAAPEAERQVQAAAPPSAKSAAQAAEGVPHETEKLSNIRKVTARRLTESKQTVPHYYLTADCRLDALLKLRAELNEGLAERGVKLSVNDLLIKALAVALTEVPGANVQFAGESLIRYSRVDISVAVALEGGLITPIVRNAAEKRLSTIAAETKDLAGRARGGKLKPEEFQGGTASISNLGMYGIKQFDAVINPPQGMILAVGAGEKRPHVVDGALAVATVITATGSFDHRAIDGATGAELMATFRRLVEAPMGMLV